jgi:hypothetical protein
MKILEIAHFKRIGVGRNSPHVIRSEILPKEELADDVISGTTFEVAA